MRLLLGVVATLQIVSCQKFCNEQIECDLEDHAALTKCIQDMIDDCVERYPEDKKVFTFTAGTYEFGSIQLHSRMEVRIDEGATLLASADQSLYPVQEPYPSYCEARDGKSASKEKLFRPFIYAENVTDVVVTGSGTVDGQGEKWWNLPAQELPWERPRLIQFKYSSNIEVGHLQLKNSPFWTLHFLYSENINAHHLTITAPWESRNTDGIDIDSSSNVEVKHCYISVGDDVIALKSGFNYCGREFNMPTKNVLIEDNTFVNENFAIGSELSGGIENVTIRYCIFGVDEGEMTDTGIDFKSSVGRGGYVKNVLVDYCFFRNVRKLINLSATYYSSENELNSTSVTHFQDITLQNLWGNTMEQAGCINGLPEVPVVNLKLDNVHLRRFGFPYFAEHIESYESVQSTPELFLPNAKTCMI